MRTQLLGAAGVRRVWAGAGPQRVAYRGGHIVRPPAQLVTINSKWETILRSPTSQLSYQLCTAK